jgi:dipeptidyl aminopeptidase/acylaminoacyl peptidase
VARLDDRLREDIERAARPADPSGLYEDLIRRRERRRIRLRVQTGAVALVVVIGTIAGLYGLSRIFRADQDRPAAGTVANGLIALTLFSYDPGSPTGPQHHIYTISPDGMGLTQVTSADVLDTSVAWSPDGRQIAFWRAKVPRPGVWVAEADGGDPRLMLETQMSLSAIHWSSDGTRIAFVGIEVAGVSGTELDFPTHLYVMTAEGANLTRVTDEGQVTDFAWSPDGELFVVERQFDAGDDRLGYDLAIIGEGGDGETPLTSDEVSRDPSWSPDGSTIVFVGSDLGSFGDPDLFAIAPDGSGLRQLTTDGQAVDDLTWSPDGTQIAFTRSTNGDGSSCELVVMSADGSSAATIADKQTLGGCPLDLAWQPILDGEDVEPVPTETPTPQPSEGEDIGLGLRLCDVTSVTGTYLSAYPDSEALVGVVPRASGSCDRARTEVEDRRHRSHGRRGRRHRVRAVRVSVRVLGVRGAGRR